MLKLGGNPLAPKRSSGRIPSIDAIRGLCLVEMMLNHLPSNIAGSVATETTGFISAAEGFVFLSGFVSGWTSVRALAAGRTVEAISRRFVSRASRLYLIYLIYWTLILAAANWGGTRLAPWRSLSVIDRGHFAEYWFLGAIFFHLSNYLDIFSLYIVLLATVPLILRQLRAGRTLSTITISGLIWTVSQFAHISHLPVRMTLGFFNVFSWQIIFTAGIVVGYHRAMQAEMPASDPPDTSSWILSASCIIALVLLVVRHPVLAGHLGLTIPHLDSFDTGSTGLIKLVSKSNLGLIRIVDFACVSYMLRVADQHAVFRVETTWVFERLAFLGQHSLSVFSCSLAITYLAFLTGSSWRDFPILIQLALAFACVSVLWIPAFIDREHSGRHFHSGDVPRATQQCNPRPRSLGAAAE